jgi:hypothetical protein
LKKYAILLEAITELEFRRNGITQLTSQSTFLILNQLTSFDLGSSGTGIVLSVGLSTSRRSIEEVETVKLLRIKLKKISK